MQLKKNIKFVDFYNRMTKPQRLDFRREVLAITGWKCSTFYYKVHRGNILLGEALQLHQLLKKYGATKEVLSSIGLVDEEV